MYIIIIYRTSILSFCVYISIFILGVMSLYVYYAMLYSIRSLHRYEGLFLILGDKSEFLSQRTTLVSHLLLHQIKTHSDECQSEHHIKGAENELLLGRPSVHVSPGHVIPEPYRRQGDETEIGAD